MYSSDLFQAVSVKIKWGMSNYLAETPLEVNSEAERLSLVMKPQVGCSYK